MRNLVLITFFSFTSLLRAGAQPIKVTGYAGTTANYIVQFEGNYFTVDRNDGYAVVDLDGKTASSGIKAPASGFIVQKLALYHGTMFASGNGGVVLKNLKGQTLSTSNYMDYVAFTTDNTVVRLPSAQGMWIVAYIDTSGKEIVRFDVRKYWSIVQPNLRGVSFVDLSSFQPFSEGLTTIKNPVTGKYGYIDKKLNLVIPVSFKNARPFSDGLAAVQNEDGNWGFINKSGKLVIPYTYSRPTSRFMSGRARVQSQDGHCGYINKENTEVIQPKYPFATCFYKGYALVREGLTQPIELIDSTGAVTATFPKDLLYIDNSATPVYSDGQLDYPFYVSETLKQLVDEGEGIFRKGEFYGLIDNKGKLVLDFKYQYLSGFHDGKMFAHYYAYLNNASVNKDGIINEKGDWLVEIVPSQF